MQNRGSNKLYIVRAMQKCYLSPISRAAQRSFSIIPCSLLHWNNRNSLLHQFSLYLPSSFLIAGTKLHSIRVSMVLHCLLSIKFTRLMCMNAVNRNAEPMAYGFGRCWFLFLCSCSLRGKKAPFYFCDFTYYALFQWCTYIELRYILLAELVTFSSLTSYGCIFGNYIQYWFGFIYESNIMCL